MSRRRSRRRSSAAFEGTPTRILVASATGEFGGALCRWVAGCVPWASVCALTRDASSPAATELAGLRGVDVVQCAPADAAALRQAAQGCERAFVWLPAVRAQYRGEGALIDACVAAGVKRIVKLSLAAELSHADAGSASGKAHFRAERHLQRSAVPSVVLRAALPFQALARLGLGAREGGRWPLPACRRPLAMVDARDVAQFAGVLIVCPDEDFEADYAGRAFSVRGSDALTAAGVATEMSKHGVGGTAAAEAAPEEAVAAALVAAGLDAEHALGIAAVLAAAEAWVPRPARHAGGLDDDEDDDDDGDDDGEATPDFSVPGTDFQLYKLPMAPKMLRRLGDVAGELVERIEAATPESVAAALAAVRAVWPEPERKGPTVYSDSSSSDEDEDESDGGGGGGRDGGETETNEAGQGEKKGGEGDGEEEEEEEEEEETLVAAGVDGPDASELPDAVNPDSLRSCIQDDECAVRTVFAVSPRARVRLGEVTNLVMQVMAAGQHDGETVLRFADARPDEAGGDADAVLRDLSWLGFAPARVSYASDRLADVHEAAVRLIAGGHAHVRLADEEPARGRGRSPAENARLFRMMRAGAYGEGEAALWLSPRGGEAGEAPAYTVRLRPHPRAGDAWCVYPEPALERPVLDSLDRATHVMAPAPLHRERRALYYATLAALGVWRPSLVPHSELAGEIELAAVADLRAAGLVRDAVNHLCVDAGLGEGGRPLAAYVREALAEEAVRVPAVARPLWMRVFGEDAPILADESTLPAAGGGGAALLGGTLVRRPVAAVLEPVVNPRPATLAKARAVSWAPEADVPASVTVVLHGGADGREEVVVLRGVRVPRSVAGAEPGTAFAFGGVLGHAVVDADGATRDGEPVLRRPAAAAPDGGGDA